MTMADAHPAVPGTPAPPKCPPWCQSDHDGEDQYAPPVIWQRAHYGFPPMSGNPTPEFTIRIARFDATWFGDLGWMVGVPHLQMMHAAVRMDVNTATDAEVLAELIGIAMPHLLAGLEAAAALAWPERWQR